MVPTSSKKLQEKTPTRLHGSKKKSIVSNVSLKSSPSPIGSGGKKISSILKSPRSEVQPKICFLSLSSEKILQLIMEYLSCSENEPGLDCFALALCCTSLKSKLVSLYGKV
mmetsp:Transcript_4598/g.7003  ORF Transcript_4598/g.7003 Transcript_4598/m.7003 type:complete len:111 (+) Transcript_4598:2468-2800(+)